jgi:catechol 2,3-dioxygenase-like lactoylglutathione lyase family enzyme
MTVNHVGLCVADLARARRFYEQALGFAHRRDLAVMVRDPDGQMLELLPGGAG